MRKLLTFGLLLIAAFLGGGLVQDLVQDLPVGAQGGGPQQNPCASDRTLHSIDSNGDGQVDVSDPVHVLTWLFRGGPEPVVCFAQEDCPASQLTTETVVQSLNPVSSEMMTSDVQYTNLAVQDLTIPAPAGNDVRLASVVVRVNARGQSSGETGVIRIRGVPYGSGSTADLADHDSAAPILGVIQVRSSTYATYELDLGANGIRSKQGWRLIVEWRTRNAAFPLFVDNLTIEARQLDTREVMPCVP